MAGLVGLFSKKENRVDPRLFKQVCDEVVFREGWRLEESASADGSLASALISKGILQRSIQPAMTDKGKTQLFIDGEVFNEDLKTQDQPQAILDAFKREGGDLFGRLNGTFVICIVESEHSRIQLISDRFATVPLYYTETPDYFAFCSELKPLLKLPGFNRTINPLGVENFISSGFFIGDTTMFTSVKTIKVGEWITITAQGFENRNYWNFSFAEQRDSRDQAEIEIELADRTAKAVRRQLSDDHSIAITTSGGYDSRCILYHLRQQKPNHLIQTVTWGTDESIPYSDAQIARQLSEALNTQHTFYPLLAEALPANFYDYVRYSEGRTDAVGNYPEGLKVFQRIREELGIDILVRGNEPFGARSEVFGKKDALHVAFMDDFTSYPHSFQYIKPKVYRSLLGVAKGQIHRLHEFCAYEHPVDCKDCLFFRIRPPGYWGPLSQLKKHHIEERNPLLDNEVVDLVRHLHPHQRVWKNLFTSSVANRIAGANQVPFAKVVSLIDWDRQITIDPILQAFIRKILLEQKNGFDDIIDKGHLESFLKKSFTAKTINRHSLYHRARRKLRNRLNVWDLEPSLEIFRLMILKAWIDLYCDGEFQIDLR
ncbi:MAG: asparagine synthase-related protein [bacterium]|nr:asparagine synthase-related protein [bacterium]